MSNKLPLDFYVPLVKTNKNRAKFKFLISPGVTPGPGQQEQTNYIVNIKCEGTTAKIQSISEKSKVDVKSTGKVKS